MWIFKAFEEKKEGKSGNRFGVPEHSFKNGSQIY